MPGLPSTATAAVLTRTRLLDAAEELFAAQGIEGASLREITRHAGQANTNAAQYHFGTRATLVDAVLARHRHTIDASRNALLDRYEAHGVADIHELASAFVAPLATKLTDPSGRAYLRIMGEVLNRPDPVLDSGVGATDATGVDSLHRWRSLVAPLLSPETADTFHVRFAAMRFAHGEFARRAAASHRRDDKLFASRVTDLVAAILAAPISDPTARLLAARPPTRRR